MLDKTINEELNKQGFKLLYRNELNSGKGMWIVVTIEDNATRSVHFELKEVAEAYLKKWIITNQWRFDQ